MDNWHEKKLFFQGIEPQTYQYLKIERSQVRIPPGDSIRQFYIIILQPFEEYHFPYMEMGLCRKLLRMTHTTSQKKQEARQIFGCVRGIIQTWSQTWRLASRGKRCTVFSPPHSLAIARQRARVQTPRERCISLCSFSGSHYGTRNGILRHSKPNDGGKI